MTLNHLNLTVVSPDETSAFLAKYFDLEPRGGNAGIQMLSDDKGMVLTLIKARAEDRDQGPGARDQGSESHSTQGSGARGQGPGSGQVRYPSSFHIGFIQPNRDRVNEINARLAADGHQVPAPSIQHGSWTFYFTAPGGFTIEVMG
jgi:catechol 2,3-dioxygenase-like lactoylglutathione lyase family enzyme